jgi:hypothetical protein
MEPRGVGWAARFRCIPTAFLYAPVPGLRPPVDSRFHRGSRLIRVNWEEHAEREEGRYADGLGRLPSEPDPRQKQLVRVAMAATGAGLARLMQGRKAEAAGWFARSAERFRESYPDAPAGSWGRLIGAVKARVLAGDWDGAAVDAEWALEQGAAVAESSIGRYAGALALLILGRDDEAGVLAETLRAESPDVFPRPVADALAGIGLGDPDLYRDGLERVLASFEERDAYLEDVPVADTVIVLEALAGRRGLGVVPNSPLVP